MATAALVGAITTAMVGAIIIIPFFLFGNVSQLGTYIEIGVFCRETGVAVPDGLAVRLQGMGCDEIQFTADGKVTFGSGLTDGVYTASWFWNQEYTREVEINCSKIGWLFTYYVPNPTITKHFCYNLELDGYPPIVGLNVTLLENDVAKAWQLTDAAGTVVFDGNHVAACRNYSLAWMYGGVAMSEGPIHFAYQDGKLPVCVWEDTNVLEPKSLGDTEG